MKKRLTLKQQKFIGGYLIHGNATQAVREAYPNIQTEGARRTMGHKLVTNGNVRAEIQAVLDREGLTPDLIVRRLRELIDTAIPPEKNKSLRTAAEIMGLIGSGGVLAMQVNIQGPSDSTIERVREVLRKRFLEADDIKKIAAHDVQCNPGPMADEPEGSNNHE